MNKILPSYDIVAAGTNHLNLARTDIQDSRYRI